MDVLINLIVAIISQCIWVLDHHIAYLKKITLCNLNVDSLKFVNHISVKLEKVYQDSYFSHRPHCFLFSNVVLLLISRIWRLT